MIPPKAMAKMPIQVQNSELQTLRCSWNSEENRIAIKKPKQEKMTGIA